MSWAFEQLHDRVLYLREHRDEWRVPTLDDFGGVEVSGALGLAKMISGNLEKAWTEHFRHFALDAEAPGRCIGCGMALGGFLGTFTWGIVHGEGNCSNCGWPVTMYHRLRTDEGEELSRLEGALCAHPDWVSAPKRGLRAADYVEAQQ